MLHIPVIKSNETLFVFGIKIASSREKVNHYEFFVFTLRAKIHIKFHSPSLLIYIFISLVLVILFVGVC